MRIGSRTFVYEHPPRIAAHASIVGPKESKGPLAAYFDESSQDDLFGQKTWEMGESEMLRRCAARAMEMGGLPRKRRRRSSAATSTTKIIATGFAARALGVPLVGLYGACSTFVEGLVLAAGAHQRRPAAKRALRRLQPLLHGRAPVSPFLWRWEHSARRRPSGRPQRPAARCSWRGMARGCASPPAHWGASSITRSRTRTTWARPWPRRWNRPYARIWTIPEQRRMISTSSPPATSAGSAARSSCSSSASAAAPCRRKAGGLRRLSVLSGTGHPRGRQRLRLRRLRLLRMADEAQWSAGNLARCCSSVPERCSAPQAPCSPRASPASPTPCGWR